ncbi:MAG TPA: bifunctional serine/threonine-protein kinase/formylglycine-generating enzyme family protein [Kofleriaceae bacterium]|nr:bifunctional serine/threonine-protein kinase/formylglycine-generating enzyme family protein [Kofleriaceae bacterium]
MIDERGKGPAARGKSTRESAEGDTLPSEDIQSVTRASERGASWRRSSGTRLRGSSGSAPAAERTSGVDAARPLPSGDDRYHTLRIIGTGGSGEVTECIDTVLGRRVALKAIKPEMVDDARAQRVLDRESQVTSTLEHPNIIPVYDAGIRSAGDRYYVMRLVSQPSLEDILARVAAGDLEIAEQYALGRLLRHFMQVCQAVDYAHSRGVIHCDLKPANILLGEFGEVLLVDWGLAYSVEDQSGFRGGTPGYMAPEQMDPACSAFDARTDVFALGAILYEILSLQPAFAGVSVASIFDEMEPDETGHLSLVPPSERAPDLDIPPVLDAICMRALEYKREARFSSAREMAAAIETFLDRKQELERRQREADLRAKEGDELAERYHELVEMRPDQLAKLASVRAMLKSWDPPDKKRVLWDAEDRIAVTDSLRVRTLQAAVAAYEQALELIGGHRQARRGLAKLYWSELRHAQERRDDLNQIYFEGLVRQYDEGMLISSLRGKGFLSVEAPTGASLFLETLKERHRRLVTVGQPRALEQPVAGLALATGSYVLCAATGDGKTVRHPLLIRSGREYHLQVEVARAATLADGDIMIPAGPALLGGDPQAPAAGELREVTVPAFAIGKWPVVFRDYLAFIADCIATGQDVTELLPQNRSDAPYWEHTGDGFVPRFLPAIPDGVDPISLPAFGITATAARAYADWVSAKTGHRYRLPTEIEWEKAARGADGRAFPWGDRFDATFCKMRESRPGPPMPEPADAFPLDQSPYGVCALAGTVAEWVIPTGAGDGDLRFASRGGAWCDWEIDCRPSAQRSYFASERSARLGFRLVRDV